MHDISIFAGKNFGFKASLSYIHPLKCWPREMLPSTAKWARACDMGQIETHKDLQKPQALIVEPTFNGHAISKLRNSSSRPLCLVSICHILGQVGSSLSPGLVAYAVQPSTS